MSRILALFRFVAVYLRELILSNVIVARDIMVNPAGLAPAFIEFETTLRKDASVLILSNLVSMTPGTITVDFDSHRRVLLIHVLNLGDAKKFREDMRRLFEEPIRSFMEPET